MATNLGYQALFAQSVVTSPRAAAGQLYPYDFAVGHPASEAFPLQECVEATGRALDVAGAGRATQIALHADEFSQSPRSGSHGGTQA